ncbi:MULTISPECIES: type II secretion system protein GspM [unclassified Thioalkalivibrio]|uniref:type II secretion system protein GspM n=1 Tax=unclassified Thioalkalivibrio TaxID=2621013 RepID=UPI00036AD4E3|nr:MULTISPECIES: type II secretion system protein GspM [unclassified Thioalkalivibrio]
MTLRGQMQTLEARLRQISLRERRLLYAVALITPFLLVLQFAVTPVEQEQERLQDEIQQQREQTQALQDQIHQFATATDPLTSLEARLADAREQVARHESELRLTSRELLSPQETASLLRQLLANRDGLQLQRLVRRSPEILASGPDSPARLESHRIELEWTGPFLDTLAYLQHLEAIPVTWLWGTLELAVEEHPVARVQLTLDALDLGGLEVHE